jgi:hypothetical protein
MSPNRCHTCCRTVANANAVCLRRELSCRPHVVRLAIHLHTIMKAVRIHPVGGSERLRLQTRQQDLGAVEAAASTTWSNGPVEGHINRLKMLKRQRYGRDGFELLRACLRPEPASGRS